MRCANPGRNIGTELARRARRNGPRLPILLTSGYSDEIAGAAGTEFPVLTKPYGADALGRAMAGVLRDFEASAA